MIVTHGSIIPNNTYKIIGPIGFTCNYSQLPLATALARLEDKASDIGADAIIGFSWQNFFINTDYMYPNIIVQGTAVKIVGKNGSSQLLPV